MHTLLSHTMEQYLGQRGYGAPLPQSNSIIGLCLIYSIDSMLQCRNGCLQGLKQTHTKRNYSYADFCSCCWQVSQLNHLKRVTAAWRQESHYEPPAWPSFCPCVLQWHAWKLWSMASLYRIAKAPLPGTEVALSSRPTDMATLQCRGMGGSAWM